MRDHGTESRYAYGPCRCHLCREAHRLYQSGETVYGHRLEACVTHGVIVNGPDEGATFTSGGAVVNIDGRRYGSHQQLEDGTVTYVWLGDDA